MSYVCYHEGFYIFDSLDIARKNSVPSPHVAFSFWLLLYQSAVAITVLSITYYLIAKLFRQKNLRIIDFFGMVALARLPLLIAMGAVTLMLKVKPNLQYLALHPNIFTSLYNLFITTLILWQLAILFYALKEASGLSGNKLIIAAIVSLIIMSAVTEPLTMLFVY